MRKAPAAPRIVPAGDAAWFIEFENRIDPAVNARAIAVAEAVRTAAYRGLREVVVGYRAVAVSFDPLEIDGEALREQLERLAATTTPHDVTERPVVTVPVCYGGEFGPDLGELAAFAGCQEAHVVRLHTAPTYRVYMIGFLPGFAYMGTVDPRIAASRRPSPRPRVPAGSVGVAGSQTGVYPMESPGGWQIIGRTPLRPFDERRTPPVIFRPGSHVRFAPIDEGEYHARVDAEGRGERSPTE